MASFGRYEIVSELGRGGMAQVFRAHDPNFNREVAVKVLPREFLHDPSFRIRFQREAQTLASLTHPAIVPVHDVGEEDGQPYLVMGYMPGGSLSDRLEDGALSVEETATIIAHIAPALDHAHQRGIIHRDLKPGNILFDEFGNSYVSDFGIVRLSEATSQLTGSGMLGTPSYMAPEMADTAEPTYMVDIYALGVTVYQMLSGVLPFEAATPMGAIAAHISKPIPDIRAANPFLPPGTQQVINRALAKNPAERFASAGELSAALTTLASDEAATQTTPAPIPIAAPTQAETFVEAAESEAPDLTAAAHSRTPPPGATYPAESPAPGGQVRSDGRRWIIIPGALLLVLIAAGVLFPTGMLGGTPATPEGPRPEIESESTPGSNDQAASNSEDAAGAATGEVISNDQGQSDAPVDQPTPVLGSPGGGGGLIMFNSDRSGLFQIYTMTIDGSIVAQLTDDPNQRSVSATWSADGSQITYARDIGDDNHEIFTMNADGSNMRQLTDNSRYDSGPHWSPDGSQIAYWYIENDIWQIAVMGVDGSNDRTLSLDPTIPDVLPRWSPDGGSIAFTGVRDDNGEVMVMAPDGSNIVQLTNEPGNDTWQDWSPDGSRLAFSSERDGSANIYIMNADGSNVIQVTHDPGEEDQPAWSPDGSLIAFTANWDGNSNIYIVNTDGSHVIQLTDEPGEDLYPQWQP